MYIGKHSGMPNEEKDEGARSIQLPQNYAGNAFSVKSEEPLREAQTVAQDAYEASPRQLPLCLEAPKKERNNLFSWTERLFSSDTLLILLAVLLSGSEDGGELAIILLLLLLF